MKNLAVIIPTMNRPHFLVRTIAWYEHIRVPVFIGDSSAKAQFKSMFPFGEYSYYCHCPGLNEIQASDHAAQVMLKQSNIKDTAYLAWAGDDDFLLPQALLRGVEILDEQPELSSVAGYATIFATKQNAVWNPIESVVGAYPDHFFRVFRRDLIIDGWQHAKDLPFPVPETTKEEHVDGAWIRSKVLLAYLRRYDKRMSIDELSLLRQVHPWRVTEDPEKREPWRARLGHRFPRLQYAHQWLRSWWQPLSLPALRRTTSKFYYSFLPVEEFLSHHSHGV